MKRSGHSLRNARTLRNNGTDAERLLWTQLRRAQVEGVKFRRQEPVEGYIVDFLAYSPKLIVELDGSQHLENRRYDEKRTACLQLNGFEVLRFWDNEIFKSLEGVVEVIRQYCLRLASPTPRPPPARGGGGTKVTYHQNKNARRSKSVGVSRL